MSKRFKICYIYDTETSNIFTKDGEAVAFPILFIFNDITSTGIMGYEQGKSDDITFARTSYDAIRYVGKCIEFGLDNDIVPIVCAYNLYFDLLPLLYELDLRWEISVNASSTVSAYTVDLIDRYYGDIVLRFFDTAKMEPGGLSVMGSMCGLPKANGDWDYTKTRTQETPLTDQELYYAKRDVQVIPAYLRYLCETDEFVREQDLGVNILTKTGIVRRMSNKFIGKEKGKSGTVASYMRQHCKANNALDFESYALRAACFRGGLSFTSARNAHIVINDVISLDVASMYHAFINGRRTPERFERANQGTLTRRVLQSIRKINIKTILESYDKPFATAFNAKLEFKNLRLKGVFSREGIGILAEDRMYPETAYDVEMKMNLDERNIAARNVLRLEGYADTFEEGEFVYGKLCKAKRAILNLNEIEYWCVCQCYDFDDVEWMEGEMTSHFCLPPDYVSLMSNYLYNAKKEIKTGISEYRIGVKNENISDLFPYTIKRRMEDGSATSGELDAFYSSVKGKYNSLFGCQAMNVNKPRYRVDNGVITIDRDTIKTRDNFTPANASSVDYNFGSRIAASSRQHLIIALILIGHFLPDVEIIGGDTDSIKIGLNGHTENEVMRVLSPLHNSITNAINRTQKRIRECYPDMASTLEGVGCFEIENSGEHYKTMCEYWTKCRMYQNSEGMFEITCAGLIQPEGKIGLVDVANKMLNDGYDATYIYHTLIRYNTELGENISHFNNCSMPKPGEIFSGEVVDYLGNKSFVEEYRSPAIFPDTFVVGGTSSFKVMNTLDYLDRYYDRHVDISGTIIEQSDDKVQIYKNIGDFDYTLLLEIDI